MEEGRGKDAGTGDEHVRRARMYGRGEKGEIRS